MRTEFEILGKHVKDVVTGFAGVATSVSFDLYGCIQVVVTPHAVKDNPDGSSGKWFDLKRLVALSPKRVMPNPFIGGTLAKVAGPENKSIPRSDPLQ